MVIKAPKEICNTRDSIGINDKEYPKQNTNVLTIHAIRKAGKISLICSNEEYPTNFPDQ